MTEPLYDLCAVGNALVDILVSTDDAFLDANGVNKGAMTLVDDARATALFEKAGAEVEMSSGGSAANTLAGFASLGGRGAFLGKVGRDTFGDVFSHDMRTKNLHFVTPPSADLPTGRCLILVTPDAQRSMNTCLAAASEFDPDDIDATVIQASGLTYLEGYLFDKPAAQQAFIKAAAIAHAASRKVSLTLSDTFCVGRHRQSFLTLVSGEVDVLFANENEIKALYETQDFAAAVQAVAAHTEIAVVTRGAAGAVIASGGQVIEVAAQPVAKVVDTTGAGDLFAAGFLYGLTQGKPLAECGRIGAIAAAEVISHYGPRPQQKLSALI